MRSSIHPNKKTKTTTNQPQSWCFFPCSMHSVWRIAFAVVALIDITLYSTSCWRTPPISAIHHVQLDKQIKEINTTSSSASSDRIHPTHTTKNSNEDNIDIDSYFTTIQKLGTELMTQFSFFFFNNSGEKDHTSSKEGFTSATTTNLFHLLLHPDDDISTTCSIANEDDDEDVYETKRKTVVTNAWWHKIFKKRNEEATNTVVLIEPVTRIEDTSIIYHYNYNSDAENGGSEDDTVDLNANALYYDSIAEDGEDDEEEEESVGDDEDFLTEQQHKVTIFWQRLFRRKEDEREVLEQIPAVLSQSSSYDQGYEDDDTIENEEEDEEGKGNADVDVDVDVDVNVNENEEDISSIVLTKEHNLVKTFWHKIFRKEDEKQYEKEEVASVLSQSNTCYNDDNDQEDGKQQHIIPNENNNDDADNDNDRIIMNGIVSYDYYDYYYYYYSAKESVTLFVSFFFGTSSAGANQNNEKDDPISSASPTELVFPLHTQPNLSRSDSHGTCDPKREKQTTTGKIKKRKKKKKKKIKAKKKNKLKNSSVPSLPSLTASMIFTIGIHILFGMMCLIEMIVRSIEARRIVFEHEAITVFENKFAETIARVYSRRKLLKGKNTYGSVSAFFFPNNNNTKRNNNYQATMTNQTQFKLNPYLPSALSPSRMTAVHRCRSAIENDNYDDDNKNKDERHHDHNSIDVTTDSDDHGDIHHAISSNDKVEQDDHKNNKNNDDEEEFINKENIILFLRSTFRLWIPVGVTCIFWLSLLPFQDYWNKLRILYDTIIPSVNTPFTDWINWDFTCIKSQEDTSMATIWITKFIQQWKDTTDQVQDYVVSTFWDRIVWEYNAVFQPKLFWNRISNVLEVVKWIRFAGPLTRMVLKLFDQFMTLFGTYKNLKSSNAQRERRINRPSMMLRDLRRIESFHKVETTLASWPSHCSVLLDIAKESLGKYGITSPSSSTTAKGSNDSHTRTNTIVHSNNYAEEFIAKNRIRGQQITHTIQNLQQKLRQSVTDFSSSEIYDSILRLTSDIDCRSILDEDDNDDQNDNDNTIHNDSPRSTASSRNGNTSNGKKSHHRRHRTSSSISRSWYDYFHFGNLLGSRDYLISPRSRFSVVWRITVTNCLLLELARLFVSWHLTQTFHLSVTQVISRSLVDCTVPEQTKQHFKFFTDRIDDWHIKVSQAIPFIPYPKEKLLTLCALPTSRSSRLLLQLGSMLESFIDIVSFMDIFFWFFTGDLDGQTGTVIPKPFIGRCIIPGTLVQIIDHPTLPKVLPAILDRIIETTIVIGWSRVIRWIVAVVPALLLIVVHPFNAYFFRHFHEDEDKTATGDDDILMRYAESFGYLPQRHTSFIKAIPSDINITRLTATETVTFPPSRSLSLKLSDIADDWDEDDESSIELNIDARPTERLQQPSESLPMRSSLKTSDLYTNNHNINNSNNTPLEEYASNVRFGNYLSKQQSKHHANDEIVHNGDDTLQGSAGFDIGLSLSSHALDDMH